MNLQLAMGRIFGPREFLLSPEWGASPSHFFHATNISSILIYKPEEKHCGMRVKHAVQKTALGQGSSPEHTHALTIKTAMLPWGHVL